MEILRLGVVGSRTLEDYDFFVKVLQWYVEESGAQVLVSGGCPWGADAFAERYAEQFGLGMTVHKPKRLTREELFGRNHDIVADSGGGVAFWDGQSNGTRHTIGLYRQARKPIQVVPFTPPPSRMQNDANLDDLFC